MLEALKATNNSILKLSYWHRLLLRIIVTMAAIFIMDQYTPKNAWCSTLLSPFVIVIIGMAWWRKEEMWSFWRKE